MGLNFMKSSSNFDNKKSYSALSRNAKSASSLDNNQEQVLPNPKPDNYKIIKHINLNNHLIIKIQYLDCINYEGIKILVFENCTIQQLTKQKLIDPHFSENKKFYSPIARFEPTHKGWNMAIKFVTNI